MRRSTRFLISIVTALLFASLTLGIATGQGEEGSATSSPVSNCATCHTEFNMNWMNSAHGTAGNDPRFQEEWTAQGKPGACLVCHTTGFDPGSGTWESENVSCTACHGPVPADHPRSPMPVDRSPDLCGRCHSDTRFGWQNWRVSAHYQRGMSCVTCHDPHSTSLKAVHDGEKADASQLCITCHKEVSMDFPYSLHHQAGLSCVDCHLEHLESADRAPHTIPDHSFNASLETCTTCHAEQMHGPGNNTAGAAAARPTPLPLMPQSASLSPEPQPVSPTGYALLAALIGLAAGMILSPWLEKIYHRLTHHH